MEKFMEIQKGCRLYEEYFLWKADSKKMLDIFDKIAKKYGIEATGFYVAKDTLIIKPTENDLIKFEKMLKKTEHGSFKRNTDISKEWRMAVLGLEHIERPRLGHYFNLWGQKWKERLFNIEEKLYCAIDSNGQFEVPEFAVEMKGSEFYKTIEEIETQ